MVAVATVHPPLMPQSLVREAIQRASHRDADRLSFQPVFWVTEWEWTLYLTPRLPNPCQYGTYWKQPVDHASKGEEFRRCGQHSVVFVLKAHPPFLSAVTFHPGDLRLG